MAVENIVIVESPAKAKTINKYLGSNYKVLASFGHIRDLPSKNGSVNPEDGFAMRWELSERADKTLKEITSALKGASTVYLATDPDREGEAISWHIREYFKEKKLDKNLEIKRVTFNEITKSSVLYAFKNARDIDGSLVDAYLARRALDYLVGFTLSPVLWRKLPGSRSAGRVQSVALRLICEREEEIERFTAEEYWSIETELLTSAGKGFGARLSYLDGTKIEKMTIKSESEAKKAVDKVNGNNYQVASVEKKQVKRNPAAPFITSTLQQEAARKLRFGASKTMRIAQKLYEGVDIGGETVGLITYMRTDGVNLSNEAIESVRKLIVNKFGEKYLPNAPRMYKSKVKNAQEAHEAIRPTDVFRSPDEVARYLSDEELKLYELIWKRTITCQMESAVLDQAAVDITDENKKVVLRATGSIIAFDGFLKLYHEDEDDTEEKEEEKRLPPLKEGDKVALEQVISNQHFTQAPPRYTEASLVKALEELGIGRPSTYASILQVLQDRNYVVLDQRRFIPDSRGRIVTSFLTNFFHKYVEYDFTANLEEQLDEITEGLVDYKKMLAEFWDDFSKAIEGAQGLSITEVINKLDDDLEKYLYPAGGDDKRHCPKCANGTLSLKLGKFGAFIGCSNYPECKYTKPVVSANGNGDVPESSEPKELGAHPTTGRSVTVRQGPYGAYVQMDAPEQEEIAEEVPQEFTKAGKPKKAKKTKTPKPKRSPLPKGFSAETLDLATAVKILELPRDVGNHPESKEMIKAGVGRFGPYLMHQGKFKSIPASDPEGVLDIGLERAVELLAQESKGRGFGVVREIGKHPEDGETVIISRGRFGPYLRHGKENAPVPKDMADKLEKITMEQATVILTEKKSKPKKTAVKKTGIRKVAAKKTGSVKKKKE